MRSSDQWAGLELRHLAALVAVAREGSFGRAAASLGYTQSAISQQIAALERIVGTVLVERRGGRHTATVTPAGAVLVEHAESITSELTAARADLAAVKAERPTLTIGTYQSVGARLLPGVMRDFASHRPDVVIRLHESNTDDELLELVANGTVDLTFAVQPSGYPQLQHIELLRDPYLLLVPASSPLSQFDGAALPPDLRGLSLIGFGECRSVCEAEARFRAAGFTAKVALRSNDNGTLQALVAAGVGAALVPRLVFDRREGDVVAIDLSGVVPPRVLVLAWARGRRLWPPVDAFVAAASRALAAAGA